MYDASILETLKTVCYVQGAHVLQSNFMMAQCWLLIKY